jgi:small-conductance mechanosensitive channel
MSHRTCVNENIPGRAASSLIHYVIIALGFFTAIGMLGVSLTRVTVLIGSLGGESASDCRVS